MTRNQTRAKELAERTLSESLPSEQLSDEDLALLMLAASPLKAGESLPMLCTRVLDNHVCKVGYFSPRHPEPHATLEKPVDPGAAHATIMIVDDHEAMRTVLAEMAAMSGYSTWCAASGHAALDDLHRVRPDLIITDWMMPDMDGIEFLRRVREIRGLQDVPLVICSCRGASHDIARALQAGATDYWVKGHFDATDLAERIEMLVQHVESNGPR